MDGFSDETTLGRAARELLEATTVDDEPLSERAMAHNLPLLTAHLRRSFRAFMDGEYDPDPED